MTKERHEGRSGASLPCSSPSWELCPGVELVRGDLTGLSCFPSCGNAGSTAEQELVANCALLTDFLGAFFPLLSPPVVLCSGADVLGGHAAPEGDVSGQTWILSQRDVSRALSLEGNCSWREGGRAWSAVPVLLPPTFPLPGARSKRHKFHLQLSHSSKCDWNAAPTLPPELGWPWLLWDGHPWTLESPICSVYPFFFKPFVFICSLLWHNPRPGLCRVGILDLPYEPVCQDRCWLSVPLIFLGWRVLSPRSC